MELKDIKLKKGMTKDEVNELISEWLTLEDDIYLGANDNHNWKCSCGRIIKGRRWGNIRHRNAILCELCYKEMNPKFLISEYIGRRYGSLVVKCESVNSSTKHRKVDCDCDCGNTYETYVDSLRSGATKSCGCYKRRYEDFTGRTYGRWTVVGLNEIKEGGHYYWKCKCICGGEGVVRGLELKTGKSKSCGCIYKDIDKTRNNNRYELDGEFGVGYTNNGYVFYFSKQDYDVIKKYTWCNKHGYLESVTFGKKISMHNLIIEPYDGLIVDHINRKKNDNRRENLRLIKQSDNVKNAGIRSNNTSGVTGVCLRNDCNKWSAYIRCDNKIYRLGTFINKDDAIKARLSAEKKYFKEFAPQKHLYEKYGITD